MEIKKQKGPLTLDEIKPYYDLWNELFGIGEAESAKAQLLGAEKDYNDITVYSEWENDTLLGTVHITTSKLCPSISTIGCVATPAHARGRGSSRRVFNAVLEDFDAAGGIASYLGTGNPVAMNLYLSLGYSFMLGTAVMRRFTNTNQVAFDQNFYTKDSCQILKNSPFLRTLIVPLATMPSHSVILDGNTRILNCGRVTQSYCESLYPRYMKLWDEGGVTYSLHNEKGALCALASAAKDGHVDCFWHSAFFEETRELIKNCETGFDNLYTVIAACDSKKRELFEGLGYVPAGELNYSYDPLQIPAIRYEKR